MLMDKTVHDFLAELKSDSPAPGGGSAAALAGALGAALAAMVGNLTIKSDKYLSVHDQASQLLQKLDEALAQLEFFVDEDTKAFTKVMQAYKLPKETTEEKEIRSRTIQESMQQAAQLPLSVAALCLEVLKLSGQMLAIGNANAASDAAVAARMAHAALWSAAYNVKINLGAIKDQDFVADMVTKLNQIISTGETKLTEIAAAADKKIS